MLGTYHGGEERREIFKDERISRAVYMGNGLSVEVENLGPFSERVRLDFSRPLVIVTGNSGTGKSFLLRLLSLMLRSLEHPADAASFEKALIKEFGHPTYVVHFGASEGTVTLRYGGETIAKIVIHRKPAGGVSRTALSSDYVSIEEWKGGSEPCAELARRSVIAPDERVVLTRRVLARAAKRRSLVESAPEIPPSARAYWHFLAKLVSEGNQFLDEMIAIIVEEGLLPRMSSYFDRGIIAGYDSSLVSSAAISLLSLAPLAVRLSEGRAFLTAVDVIELHLTPLLQAAAAVNLARWAKKGWRESEESPAPLLIVTHSPVVLSALLTEVEEGVRDRSIRLPETYKLERKDLRMVVFQRDEGALRCEVHEEIAMPNYLREYSRFL